MIITGVWFAFRVYCAHERRRQTIDEVQLPRMSSQRSRSCSRQRELNAQSFEGNTKMLKPLLCTRRTTPCRCARSSFRQARHSTKSARASFVAKATATRKKCMSCCVFRRLAVQLSCALYVNGRILLMAPRFGRRRWRSVFCTRALQQETHYRCFCLFAVHEINLCDLLNLMVATRELRILHLIVSYGQ